MVLVAPYVGAWIETIKKRCSFLVIMSHPMWVRGLKLTIRLILLRLIRSHPMWVRGLKPTTTPKLTLTHGRTLCGCVD